MPWDYYDQITDGPMRPVNQPPGSCEGHITGLPHLPSESATLYPGAAGVPHEVADDGGAPGHWPGSRGPSWRAAGPGPGTAVASGAPPPETGCGGCRG